MPEPYIEVIVTFALAIMAGICGFLAGRSWERLMRAMRGDK